MQITLAKQAIDVGLFTNAPDAVLRYWQRQVGVPFAELLPIGNGVRQHRHAIGESVLKINDCRDPLPLAAAGGIRALTIADPSLTEPWQGTDPDGNMVQRVPPGHDGVEQLRVALTVSDLASHQRFYGEVLEFPALDPVTFQCGVSQIRLTEGDATRDPEQRAQGYRYLTIQVRDVNGCHAEILRRGGREGRAPVTLGSVARISFVRDPDGNWIEVSQRKSITGSLD